jgi:hypothetical protein
MGGNKTRSAGAEGRRAEMTGTGKNETGSATATACQPITGNKGEKRREAKGISHQRYRELPPSRQAPGVMTPRRTAIRASDDMPIERHPSPVVERRPGRVWSATSGDTRSGCRGDG